MKSNKDDYLSQLTPATTQPQIKFHYSELKEECRLTLDVCETYLQYLSHCEDSHYKGRTAILSIHTAFLFEVILSQKDEYAVEKAKQQASHLMLQYRGIYRIFRGFWKHIIIPLVLPKKYNHFSFARVSIEPEGMICTYYDSMLQASKCEEMRELYFQLIRAVFMQ